MLSNSFPSMIIITITFWSTVIDTNGSKEAVMKLSKIYVVWSILHPMGIDRNDAVVCLKEKSTRESIHLKRYILNIPPTGCISLVD